MTEEVRRWVIEGPAKQGPERDNRTHAELAEHLYRIHGIGSSRSAMKRFCRKRDVRVYRRTHRFLRGDPVDQAAARQDLAGLGKKRGPAS